MASRPEVPRIVNPRKHGYTHLPIVAVDLDRDVALYEGTFQRHGEVLTVEELCSRLQSIPPALVVSLDSARLLAYLDDMNQDHPRWQFRVTPMKRQVMKANGQLSKWSVQQLVVNFFGWQRENGHHLNHYHYPMDPALFCRATIAELLPPGLEDDGDRVHRLLAWGQDIRDWCQVQDMKVTPTAGGLAAQLLRDPRFFPEPRRKVPRATNARVRPRLPGNFYHLYGDVDRRYNAYYLDMTSAHHNIAATIDFPHPDRLVARGYFDVSDVPGVTVTDGRPWARVRSKPFRMIMEEAVGLLFVKLDVPVIKWDRFPPPYLRSKGQRMAWIYTNELPMIRDLGARIEHITAAWVSFDTDPGLNRYARFAMEELEGASDARKRWLKPALLSPYGLLAARPMETEIGFKQARGGMPKSYPAGSRLLRATAMVRSGAQESPLANVMYRGMIEAEQRKRALEAARYFTDHGHRVLAIYADSVFVESGPPLPFLPDGWRIQDHLDGLYFASATHFTSRQLTKLPGIPRRDASERVQLMAGLRGALTVGAKPLDKAS